MAQGGGKRSVFPEWIKQVGKVIDGLVLLLTTVCLLSASITATPEIRWHHPHFMDEETEASKTQSCKAIKKQNLATVPNNMLLLFSCSVMSDSSTTLGTAARQAPQDLGIVQARILEWVAIFSSRGSFWSRDWTCVSCTGRQILYHWATRGALLIIQGCTNEFAFKNLNTKQTFSFLPLSLGGPLQAVIKYPNTISGNTHWERRNQQPKKPCSGHNEVLCLPMNLVLVLSQYMVLVVPTAGTFP